MTDIQFQLLKAGLTTGKKINTINRQKAIDNEFILVAGKAKPGASPKIWEKYARLKKLASKNLQFAY